MLPVLQNLQFAGVFLLLPCKWSCHGKEETYPKVLLWYLNQPPKKPCRGTLDDFLQYYEGEKKKSLKPPNYMLKVYGNKSKHPRHTNYNMSSHHYIAVHIDPPWTPVKRASSKHSSLWLRLNNLGMWKHCHEWATKKKQQTDLNIEPHEINWVRVIPL